MGIAYTLMARVLWGSQQIGESSQAQLNLIHSKQKVVRMLIYGKSMQIISKTLKIYSFALTILSWKNTQIYSESTWFYNLKKRRKKYKSHFNIILFLSPFFHSQNCFWHFDSLSLSLLFFIPRFTLYIFHTFHFFSFFFHFYGFWMKIYEKFCFFLSKHSSYFLLLSSVRPVENVFFI